jgi:hypothetical protein
MKRIVQRTTVSSDGSVHLDLSVGAEEAGLEVQVTVEPFGIASKGTLRASELLNSALVGIWADRSDIGDSREFARRLRKQAETRRSD